MPTPPLLSGTTYTTGVVRAAYLVDTPPQPRLRKGDLVQPRLVRTGLEAGRGGSLARPQYGQLYPRGIRGGYSIT